MCNGSKVAPPSYQQGNFTPRARVLPWPATIHLPANSQSHEMRLDVNGSTIVFVAILAFLSSAILPSSVYAAPVTQGKTGVELVSTTFDSITAKGMWLVEYFSPYCSHCKAFAPTWTMLVDMHEHLADSSDFHFARVDCIAQGDLCSAHDITGYPSVRLHADGKKIEQFQGDRSYEELSTYILTHAKQYREQKSAFDH